MTQTKNYTVPLSGTDTPVATSFLNQEGNWTVPAGVNVEDELDDLTDVNIINPDDGQFLVYNSDTSQGGNVDVDPANPITGGTGIKVISGVVSIEDDGVGTTQLASNAVTSAKIAVGGVARTNIADNAINDGKLDATNTGTANQILSATGSGNFTWIDADGNTALHSI